MAVYGLSRALLPHVCHAVTAINGGLRFEQGAPAARVPRGDRHLWRSTA
jgi:hypothetical protein